MRLARSEEYEQGKIISIITNDLDDIGKWQKSLFLIGNTVTKFVGGIISSVLLSWGDNSHSNPVWACFNFHSMLYLRI